MAKVPVQVAVDAGAFVSFYDVWQKYRDAFKDQPAAWEAVADSAGKSRESFADAADSMRQLADGMDEVLGRTRDLGRETRKVATSWQHLTRFTRETAGHLSAATGSLLKWAGIGGLLAGAAGFGAEHAIFDVAGAVGARRSTALGYGTTYGGLQSARVNFERFGDADSALGNIAAAQSGDLDKRLGLQNLGVDSNANRDPVEILADVMKRAKDKVDAKPAGIGLQQYAHNLHLDDLLSMDTIQRLQHGGRAEVYGQADKMLADRRGLDLAPDVQKKWQDLATKIAAAGKTIETALINRLVALEPGLEKLSKALADAGATLLKKDGPVAQWLAEADEGLKKLAGLLDDPDTQKRFEDFVAGIGHAAEFVWDLGKKALALLDWLAKLTGDNTSSSDTAADGGVTPLTPGAGTDLGKPAGMTGGRAAARADAGSRSPNRAQFGYRGTPSKGKWWTDDRIRHAYDKLVAGGLSPREAEGQISRMAFVEAGAGPTAGNSAGGGHYGIFQADRARQRDFGGSSDFDAQLDAIVKEKKSSEAASHRAGLAAKDDFEAARAASMFERAEGYTQRRDGTDNFTAKTLAGIPAIHKIVTGGRPPAAPAKVTVNPATGANPHTAVAAAAAPP